LNPEVTNAKSDAGSIDIVPEPLKTGLQGIFFIACTQVNPNAGDVHFGPKSLAPDELINHQHFHESCADVARASAE
jgi:hypothetical protein